MFYDCKVTLPRRGLRLDETDNNLVAAAVHAIAPAGGLPNANGYDLLAVRF